MKSNLLIATLLFSSALCFAAPAPQNAENYLWVINGQGREFHKQGCATSKESPYTPIVCFGEKKNSRGQFEGYALLREAYGRLGMQYRDLEEYKVRAAGKWTHIGSDRPIGIDTYARKLTLTDKSGRESTVTEVFEYQVVYGEENFRTTRILGALPNGTKIDLKNIFMFY